MLNKVESLIHHYLPIVVFSLPMFLWMSLLTPTNHVWASEVGDLKVTVTGVRTNSGQIVLGLHLNESGFPDKPAKVYTCLIEENVCEIVLKELSYGEYALALYHDENNNSSLDHGFLGLIHKEGFGVSNNKRRRFSPPRYQDAKFDFVRGVETIAIALHY